jgi:hypothetical protein
MTAPVDHCEHAWVLDVGRVRCMLCGVLAHASPTQLEDWRACPRKWKYRRLRRLFPVPDNVWAAFGSRAHVIREHWLKSGTWTTEIAESKEGQCVAAGIEYWPRPGVALGVEIELERIELLGGVGDVPWTFKIDDVAPPTHHYDLGDLKTIGQLAKRKTEADLEEDAQRVVYVVWAGPTLRRDTIRSAWSYCQRSPANFAPVMVEGKVEHDRQRLAVINNEAREMLRANIRPLDEQDRNRSTCYKYRGFPCVYAEHCLADQNDLDLGAFGAYTLDTMTAPITLADALAAQAAAPLPPMPGAAPALPPVPVAPPRVQLTPELEQWVASCVAAGHPEADVRAKAEAAMAPTPAAAPAPAPAAAPVVAPEPTVPTTIAPTGAGGETPAPTPTTTTTTRRARTPKASTDAAPSTSTDVRMIAATLAARAVSGPASPALVVDAYFDVLELLAEGSK